MKLLSILCVLVIAFSCKKSEETSAITTTTTNDSLLVKAADISKIKYTDYILDSKTEDFTINWKAYNQLTEVISKIKAADLSFFNNNAKEVKELISNLKLNIPENVNSPSILARISALETKILKLESLTNLSTTSKTELLNNIQDVLVAYSNLNLQMNKKVENDHIIIEKP
ncbi:hypothetical protein [Mariniflexile sp. AS56]|uniref:hypothetical protein n=1 Tax=Mariniflexile sp. AS56 TaxID=3063957 RepID=UPI0026ED3762|nr:hypothetical protein [Mariniflexile sp. AS56]MDO7173500.1 hypothetical protein [Mariniflexile sp. AS56]